MHLVIDAISEASRNVAILLSRDLEHPPIPIASVKKQGDTTMAPKNNEEMTFQFEEPKSEVKVFEVWKVFLTENEEELDEVYVIISADYNVEGYKKGKWSNIKYRGFYTTKLEAVNEINGYLR